MKVVIIGSGNVANVLGRMILKADHSVVQIVGRNKTAVANLAKELNAKSETNIENIFQDADLYIIAVSDNAVAEISKQLQLKSKLVVHTAGSISKDVLQNVSTNYGVLYPLQSLRKEIKYSPVIPLLVDGNSEKIKTKLMVFAKTISTVVKKAGDEERLKLHTAAVITSNFTNHLFALTKNFCENEKVDFNLLLPLIEETVQRLHQYEPSEMQTGPAMRNDKATMKRHLQLLKEYPALKRIYALMSESILKESGF